MENTKKYLSLGVAMAISLFISFQLTATWEKIGKTKSTTQQRTIEKPVAKQPATKKTIQQIQPKANQITGISGLTREELKNLSGPLAAPTQPTRLQNTPMLGQKGMAQTLRSQQEQQQPTNQLGLTKEEFDILSSPLAAPTQPTRLQNTPMLGQKGMAQTLRSQQGQQQPTNQLGLTKEEFDILSSPLAAPTQPTRLQNTPMLGQKGMAQTLRSQQGQQQPTNQLGLTKEEFDILSSPLAAPTQPTRLQNTPMLGQKGMAQTLRSQQGQQPTIKPQANQFNGASGLTQEELENLDGAL